MIMEKTTKTLLAAATIAGTTFIGAQSVQADTTVSSNNTPQTETVKPATDTKSAQANVDAAQAGVNAAQNTANQAKTTLDQANDQVKNAQAQVDTANNAVKTAQDAQKQATPTKIADTKQDVANQTQVVKDAQQNVANQQESVDQAKQSQTKAQADLAQAQTSAQQADQNVANAQQAVKDAQAVVDGANADQIKANAQDAQAKVDQAQANLTNAVKDANQAHKDLTAAKDTADNAQKAVNTAQTAASQAQANYNNAQVAVKSAQNKVNQINDQLNSINTIVLPKGYQDSDEAALSGLNINHYKDVESDKNITVDPLNLTNEQQRELTVWIASILNGTHKQLGYNNMNVVTDSSLNYAKVVADNYWNKFDHDLSALKKAQDSVGGTQFRSESIGWGYIPTATTNLNDLKRGIYNCMLDMIFDDADSGWGHAQQLLGIDLATFGDPAENYLGFSIDKNGILHFENYVPARSDTSTKYEVPSNDTKELQGQLSVATQDLTAKQKDLATKQTANDQANQAVKAAQANLTQANQVVNDTQAKVTQADNNVSDLKSQLQTAQDQAKQAQALVDQLNASMPAKTPFYQVAGQLFDGQGKPVTGYTVKNGQVFDEKGNLVGVVKGANSRAVKKVMQANNAALPQTGTKEGNLTLLGSLALALAGFLGLSGVDRKFKRPLVK